MKQKMYVCIDLKAFYGSVECVERGLNPLTTNLVVADESRTQKTICLSVTPSLKKYGLSGRARLFEVIQKVKKANEKRLIYTDEHKFTKSSYDEIDINRDPNIEISYIVAPPRMAYYMQYSTRIYNIYLKYIAPEDIHVYSIDEVFIDVTDYLHTYEMTAHDLAMKMIKDVLKETGITATAGIGTNMYLAKIAMDIVAKRLEPDADGVRIAQLDEMSYRQQLWDHRPIIDFWRVGRGYSKKLEQNGLYTMGDIARCSIGKTSDFYNEDLLYKLFGINAELLIDHAWGWEPCTIADIKEYKPRDNSIGSGQVLHCAYDFAKARVAIKEMADMLSLDLVEKKLVTNQIVMTIGYDIENISNPEIRKKYKGPITTDEYGRKMPKHAHGTQNIGKNTSSTKLITNAAMELFDRIVNDNLLIKRLYITANHVVDEKSVSEKKNYEQLNLFTDYEKIQKTREQEEEELKKEKDIQRTILDIKKKFGKNAILKGMNMQEGATSIDRNNQIGGHKA